MIYKKLIAVFLLLNSFNSISQLPDTNRWVSVCDSILDYNKINRGFLNFKSGIIVNEGKSSNGLSQKVFNLISDTSMTSIKVEYQIEFAPYFKDNLEVMLFVDKMTLQVLHVATESNFFKILLKLSENNIKHQLDVLIEEIEKSKELKIKRNSIMFAEDVIKGKVRDKFLGTSNFVFRYRLLDQQWGDSGRSPILLNPENNLNLLENIVEAAKNQNLVIVFQTQEKFLRINGLCKRQNKSIVRLHQIILSQKSGKVISDGIVSYPY